MLKVSAACVMLLLISACSSKEMYRFGQDYQKSDCARNVVSLEQYDSCLQTNQLRYEDYQQEREAVIKNINKENNN